MAATAILKIAFFGRNSSTDCPMLAKFCVRKQNRMPTKATWKNCKFLKSEMANGRHFENRYIAISLWKIFRFQWTLVHNIRYWTWLRSRDQKLKFLKFDITTAAILKIAFLAITHQPIVRYQRNFAAGNRTACRQRPHDKNCKFSKSKMAAAPAWKSVFWP